MLPPDGPAERREFDLLILDEAHHVAPAAPKQRYAVDSQQTKLIRRPAPHFEHRLFLTATPHNGYQESFEALLELVDNQRFARGVAPDPRAQREVVIRRLKTDILEPGDHLIGKSSRWPAAVADRCSSLLRRCSPLAASHESVVLDQVNQETKGRRRLKPDPWATAHV